MTKLDDTTKTALDGNFIVMCSPIPLPDISSRPHLETVFEAWEINETYIVLIAQTEKYKHLRIRRKDDKPITHYRIFQEIKNRFFGDEVEAVQVFPKKSNYVDNTNTYHIFSWEEIQLPNLKQMYHYEERKGCT